MTKKTHNILIGVLILMLLITFLFILHLLTFEVRVESALATYFSQFEEADITIE